ncbi:MAG: ImuA family protein [Magnetovibrionaceae bacterium]
MTSSLATQSLSARQAPPPLARLRRQVQRLEKRAPSMEGGGLASRIELDLPPFKGLARDGLHEILIATSTQPGEAGWAPMDGGGAGNGAGLGFALHALGRCLAQTPKRPHVLWCRGPQASLPYLDGLMRFGLGAENLLLVRAASTTDLLWAAEEGLNSAALAGVLMEPDSLTPVAARRLKLAAATSATPALLLRPESRAGTLPVTTRWRVWMAPGDGEISSVRWRVTLIRSSSGEEKLQGTDWIYPKEKVPPALQAGNTFSKDTPDGRLALDQG